MKVPYTALIEALGSRRVSACITVLAVGLLVSPSIGGTIIKLNEGDPHPSWAHARINNLGHVALVKATTSNYSGGVWLWTGDWSALASYVGTYVSVADRRKPPLQFNDLDRIAYSGSSYKTYLFDLSGQVSLGTEPSKLDYYIDVNNSNQIAAYSWNGSATRVYAADSPYSSYVVAAQASNISYACVVLNDVGQIAYSRSTTIYRYTPGAGSAAVDSFNYTALDMDNLGRIIHLRDGNKVMLDNMILRNSANVVNGGEYGQVAVSDNGRYVAWTENAGAKWEDWDLWTLVDGMPTNLTQGAYGTVYNPDVNNEGKIVFAGAVTSQLSSSPYGSNVYMYAPDGDEPAVYNGHFNGNTLFGWTPIVEGLATVALVETSTGGFAARLTAGSPAALKQTLIIAAGTAELAFDFDFLSADGALTVTLDGVLLATLTANDDTQAGFTRLALSGAIGANPSLEFRFDGPAGAAVYLDNVTVIPEPATLALLALGGLAMLRRRRLER